MFLYRRTVNRCTLVSAAGARAARLVPPTDARRVTAVPCCAEEYPIVLEFCNYSAQQCHNGTLMCRKCGLQQISGTEM